MAAMQAQPSVQEILPRVLQDLRALTTQDGFQQLTNYVNELALLQAKVQAQDTTIDLLSGTIKDRLDEMQGDKRKLKALKDSLAETQRRLTTFEKQAREAEAIKTTLERQLDDEIKKVNMLSTFRIELETNPSMIREKWAHLYSSTTQLAEKYFGGFCSEDILMDSEIWEHLQGVPLLEKLPIPVSNSESARRIRTIIAIAIISDAFVTNIFRVVGFNGIMRKKMLDLAITRPNDEAHCRSSLLGALHYLPEYGEEIIIRSTKEIKKSVESTLRPLLVPSEHQEFTDGVLDLCKEATETWSLIQRDKFYYQAHMNLNFKKWEPIEGDKGGVPTKPNASEKGDGSHKPKAPADSPQVNGKGKGRASPSHLPPKPTLPVWPVLVLLDGEAFSCFIAGKALFPEQTEVAQAEVKKQRRRSVAVEKKSSPGAVYDMLFGMGNWEGP